MTQYVTIVGRVGADAEVRDVRGKDVCNFSVAADQGYGDRKQTNWWRCALWGDRAGKIAPYIKKGETVVVIGEFELSEYNGKPQLGIQVREVNPFLGNKREGGGATTSSTPASSPQDYGSDLDDDVPFLTNDPAMEARVG